MTGTYVAAIQAIKPGVRCSEVYAAVKAALQERGGDSLVKRLGRNVGFGTGFEFRQVHEIQLLFVL